MRIIVLCFVLVGILTPAVSQTEGNISVLDPEVFQERIHGDSVQLLDVRTPTEYNAGHIEGAVNIDWLQRQSFSEAIDTLNRNRPVYLYCRLGNRSQQAAEFLQKQGFETIIDLKGGYTAWRK